MLAVAALPRDTPEPPPPTAQDPKTLTRWDQFLGAVATGKALEECMVEFHMRRQDIEACIRRAPIERERWDQARLAARLRAWSAFDFEEIFELIAQDTPVKRAVEQIRGTTADHATFLRAVIVDPILKQQYETALKARAIAISESMTEIADDKTNDILEQEKGPVGNSAAVQRSKLQVEHRRWQASSWYRRMFGEREQNTQVNVQINHAARLEEARERAKTRTVRAVSREEMQRAVDATFVELQPQPSGGDEPVSVQTGDLDTSWLDVTPQP